MPAAHFSLLVGKGIRRRKVVVEEVVEGVEQLGKEVEKEED